MATYSQFTGYPFSSQFLVVGPAQNQQTANSTVSPSAATLGYTHLCAPGGPQNSLSPTIPGVYASPYGNQVYPSNIDASAFYSQLMGTSYNGMKDTGADMNTWSSVAPPAATYSPYSPTLPGYRFNPYENAHRRKNEITTESRAILKAWLNEHIKYPYPTKGEKIMLAIMTKMTLIQVSTWFANARRRVRKENKVTWDLKNKTEDDLDDDCDKDDSDDAILDDTQHKDGDMTKKAIQTEPGEISRLHCSDGSLSNPLDRLKDLTKSIGLIPSPVMTPLSSDPCAPSSDSALKSDDSDQFNKPKIWSLADTATCKNPQSQYILHGSTSGCFSSIGGTAHPNPHPSYSTRSSSMPYDTFAYSVPSPFCKTAGPPAGIYLDVSADTPPQTSPNVKDPLNPLTTSALSFAGNSMYGGQMFVNNTNSDQPLQDERCNQTMEQAQNVSAADHIQRSQVYPTTETSLSNSS